MRIYDGKYLSVTSVVGLRDPFDDRSFKSWCKKVGKNPEFILSSSKVMGEKVSNMLDNNAKGLEWLSGPPVDKTEEKLFEGVQDFLLQWDLLDTEKTVYCEDLHYAGRFDGIIEKNGKKLLADWKTYGAWKSAKYKRDSKKIKHVKWQLTLYANALDWTDGLAVVVFKNDGTWELEEVEFDNEMMEWVSDNQELIKETIKKNLSKLKK